MPVIETLNHNIELPIAQIQDFCQRWHITEFALFGSVLRSDFRPDSDIDILVRFSPSFRRGLEETLQMRQELQTLFNRNVDLIEKTAIERSENWLRRKNMLESAQAIYSVSQIDAICSHNEHNRPLAKVDFGYGITILSVPILAPFWHLCKRSNVG